MLQKQQQQQQQLVLVLVHQSRLTALNLASSICQFMKNENRCLVKLIVHNSKTHFSSSMAHLLLEWSLSQIISLNTNKHEQCSTLLSTENNNNNSDNMSKERP